VTHGIAAESPVLVFEQLKMALVKDDEPLLRDQLAQNTAAEVIVVDRLPHQSEPKVIEKAFHVEAGRKPVALPQLAGSRFNRGFWEVSH
jgi:hypothetical protein